MLPEEHVSLLLILRSVLLTPEDILEKKCNLSPFPCFSCLKKKKIDSRPHTMSKLGHCFQGNKFFRQAQIGHPLVIS